LANCYLKITLDKTSYTGGETLRGVLHVDVNEVCKCSALLLSNCLSAYGDGNTDQKSTEELNLFSGTWQPGQYQYPFELTMPHEAFSYKGKHININRYLQATADIPWAFDPKTECKITLQSDNSYNAKRKQSALTQYHKEMSSGLSENQLFAAGIALFILAGLMFAFLVQAYWITALLGVTGLVVIYLQVQPLIAEFKIGKVQYSLSEYVANPEDTLHCNVMLTPRTSSTINNISATLTGKEIAISGAGKNQSTHSHTFYKKQFIAQHPQQIEAGMPLNVKIKIDIPEDAIFSFKSKSNAIIWNIEAHIDIDNWPDWKESKVIRVVS